MSRSQRSMPAKVDVIFGCEPAQQRGLTGFNKKGGFGQVVFPAYILH